MTAHVSSVRRAAGLDSIFDALNAGTIEIRSGAQESNPEAAAAGTLLASCTFGDPAFGAGTGAAGAPVTKTANSITSGTAVATGTAGHFRLVTVGGTCVMIGDVGVSASDLDMPVNVGQGATVSINNMQLSQAY